MRSVLLNRRERPESAARRAPDGTVTENVTSATVPAPTPTARVDTWAWFRRVLVALAAVAVLVLASGIYLTFKYRPASRINAPGIDHPSWLVDLAQPVHAIGGYLLVLLVFAAVGLALANAAQRSRGLGVITASGIGLVFVSIAFVITGRRLPWGTLTFVASGLATSFSGIIGFPAEVTKVLVGNSHVSPARYETTAWIHIAGLPVFAVFATWCMLGAIQASRSPKAAAKAGSGNPNAVRAPAEPARPVGAAEVLFGTDDPETVRLQIDTFLLRHLGTGVQTIEFTKLGDGVVLGVLTHDGRHVVVRVHPRGTNVAFRRAVQEVQLHLGANGFPAPRPLLDAQPFGIGIATVESALVQLPPADTRDRMIRRALADGLAAFVLVAAPLASRPEFAHRGPLRPAAPGSVFPPPFSSSATDPIAHTIDYAATASGAEWIEELGGRARLLLDAAPEAAPVLGHFEWRDENVPSAGGRIAAVYAWNNIGTATEAVVVGAAAHQFTISSAATIRVPTLVEVQEFMSDYEAARGVPFTTAERVTARTAYVFCTAYGARCEHALAASGHPTSTAFREQLTAHGAALLG